MRPFSNLFADDARVWLNRARNGDARAWSKLVEQYANLVYACTRKCGLNPSDAEDAFQSTFVALFRNLDRIEQPEALSGWIATTATRESIKVKRLSSRYDTLAEDERGLDELIASEDRMADEIVAEVEEGQSLRRLVEDMGGRCRDLLTRLYFDEMSYEQVVEQLGIPIGAIGPTRARCLEKLRKMYQDSSKETPLD